MWSRVLIACGLVVVAACDKSPTPAGVSAGSPRATAAPAAASQGSYELQEKCARDTREWYKHAWEKGPSDPDVIIDYTNHYNAKIGKCLVVLQVTILAGTTPDHTNRLMDLLENRDIGVVQWFEGKVPGTCEVHGQRCKSTDEWNGLVKPYMED